MTNTNTVDLAICVDCLFLLANGEGPDDVAERLAVNWPSDTITLGRIGLENPETSEYDEPEPWFSWSPCDGCGSSLGGYRHAATGWIE